MYKKLGAALLTLSIIALSFLSIHYVTYAQFIAPISANPTEIKKDIFRVGITLFGVDNQTGDIFSLVKVNNHTVTKLINTTRQDLSDHDGVVESFFSFPNETIQNGTMYSGCILVVKTANYTCAKGYNSPSPRIEFLQFSLK